MTLLDYLLQPTVSIDTVTTSALGHVIQQCGKIDRVVAVVEDDEKKLWLTPHFVFRTTLNDKSKSYILCTWTYPLQVQ